MTINNKKQFKIAARCNFSVRMDDIIVQIDSSEVILMLSALQEISRISDDTNSSDNYGYIADNILSVIYRKPPF